MSLHCWFHPQILASEAGATLPGINEENQLTFLTQLCEAYVEVRWPSACGLAVGAHVLYAWKHGLYGSRGRTGGSAAAAARLATASGRQVLCRLREMLVWQVTQAAIQAAIHAAILPRPETPYAHTPACHWDPRAVGAGGGGIGGITLCVSAHAVHDRREWMGGSPAAAARLVTASGRQVLGIPRRQGYSRSYEQLHCQKSQAGDTKSDTEPG